MIERLLFPQRPGFANQLVDAVSSGAFETLKYVDERKGPSIFIAQRLYEYVDVVGHYHDSMQLNSSSGSNRGRGRPRHTIARKGNNSAFPQTMCQHDIPSGVRQNLSCTSAERDEQIGIGFLNMRESAAVVVLREDWIRGHRWVL